MEMMEEEVGEVMEEEEVGEVMEGGGGGGDSSNDGNILALRDYVTKSEAAIEVDTAFEEAEEIGAEQFAAVLRCMPWVAGWFDEDLLGVAWKLLRHQFLLNGEGQTLDTTVVIRLLEEDATMASKMEWQPMRGLIDNVSSELAAGDNPVAVFRDVQQEVVRAATMPLVARMMEDPPAVLRVTGFKEETEPAEADSLLDEVSTFYRSQEEAGEEAEDKAWNLHAGGIKWGKGKLSKKHLEGQRHLLQNSSRLKELRAEGQLKVWALRSGHGKQGMLLLQTLAECPAEESSTVSIDAKRVLMAHYLIAFSPQCMHEMLADGTSMLQKRAVVRPQRQLNCAFCCWGSAFGVAVDESKLHQQWMSQDGTALLRLASSLERWKQAAPQDRWNKVDASALRLFQKLFYGGKSVPLWHVAVLLWKTLAASRNPPSGALADALRTLHGELVQQDEEEGADTAWRGWTQGTFCGDPAAVSGVCDIVSIMSRLEKLGESLEMWIGKLKAYEAEVKTELECQLAEAPGRVCSEPLKAAIRRYQQYDDAAAGYSCWFEDDDLNSHMEQWQWYMHLPQPNSDLRSELPTQVDLQLMLVLVQCARQCNDACRHGLDQTIQATVLHQAKMDSTEWENELAQKMTACGDDQTARKEVEERMARARIKREVAAAVRQFGNGQTTLCLEDSEDTRALARGARWITKYSRKGEKKEFRETLLTELSTEDKAAIMQAGSHLDAFICAQLQSRSSSATVTSTGLMATLRCFERAARLLSRSINEVGVLREQLLGLTSARDAVNNRMVQLGEEEDELADQADAVAQGMGIAAAAYSSQVEHNKRLAAQNQEENRFLEKMKAREAEVQGKVDELKELTRKLGEKRDAIENSEKQLVSLRLQVDCCQQSLGTAQQNEAEQLVHLRQERLTERGNATAASVQEASEGLQQQLARRRRKRDDNAALPQDDVAPPPPQRLRAAANAIVNNIPRDEGRTFTRQRLAEESLRANSLAAQPPVD